MNPSNRHGLRTACGMGWWFPLGVLVVLSLSTIAWAHGGANTEIARLTQQLAEHPGNPQLYLQRARLHTHSGAREAAMLDLDRAARLAKLPELDFLRGEVLHSAGKHHQALAYLEHYLNGIVPEDHAANLRALRKRADIYTALDNPRAAATDLARVIALAPKPSPEDYLQHARALLAVCPPASAEASATLSEGLERVGPAVVLIDEAVTLAHRNQHYDIALGYIDRLPVILRETPKWLKRQADILGAAGRLDQATAAYAHARRQLQTLPDARRQTRAARALEQQIADAQSRLKSPPQARARRRSTVHSERAATGHPCHASRCR